MLWSFLTLSLVCLFSHNEKRDSVNHIYQISLQMDPSISVDHSCCTFILLIIYYTLLGMNWLELHVMSKKHLG